MMAVLRRELRAMFVSPLAWFVLAVVQVLMAYSFLRLLQAFADNQGRLQGLPGAPGLTRLVAMPLFEVAAFVMMLIVPLITMRLIAEERRVGTLVLLLGSPVSSTSIILGKFFGAFTFAAPAVGRGSLNCGSAVGSRSIVPTGLGAVAGEVQAQQQAPVGMGRGQVPVATQLQPRQAYTPAAYTPTPAHMQAAQQPMPQHGAAGGPPPVPQQAMPHGR